MAVAADLDGRGRAVCHIAVDDAIAVVHGADKLAWASLLGFALALGAANGIAGLVGGGIAGRLSAARAFLEEFLLLAALSLSLTLVSRSGSRGRGLGHDGRRRCLRLRWGLLALLRLWRTLQAAFILAAAPPAPMPLRLHLAVRLCRPQFSLGLRRICRHSFTSWQCAFWCTAFFCSGALMPASELTCLLPYSQTTGKLQPAIQLLEDVWQTAAKPSFAQFAPILERGAPVLPCRSLREKPTERFSGSHLIWVRLVLSSCNALLMGIFRRVCLKRNKSCDESSLLGGECALPAQQIQVAVRGECVPGPMKQNARPTLRYHAISLKMVLWVARVSRLVGKSDITAKRCRWQVCFADSSPEGFA